jgi:gamma-glutamyltranspeptidase/glutathione hydrolase
MRKIFYQTTLKLTLLTLCMMAVLHPVLSQQIKETGNAYNYSIQKKSTGSKGAVVSAHPLASKAGLDMLRKGGNAIDAAIATQLALAVVYPGAGNIGGGGFLVASLADGKSLAIDYREKAPAAAHRDMYLDSAGNARTQLSQSGHLASGVPGTIAGLFTSHKYAKLTFTELIEPAIELAEKGFVITASEASSLNSTKNAFIQHNTQPNAFIRDRTWKAGDTLVQADLANTLKRVKEQGMKGFYEGETARLIVEEMKRGKGLITYDDLKNYTAKEREAIRFPYKEYTVITMPLPSSGGLIIQQALKILETRDLAKMGFQTPASVQLITEIERRAYADRAEFMGDADFVKVPVKTLVSDAYLKERMKTYEPGKAGKSSAIRAGNINAESEETTHLSVADQWGNAVSVTTTLNGGYGSRTVVGGAGFLLNNEMDDFSVKPGVPNMYGAIGAEANAIAPGKRMLSSMTPTIVLRKEKPYLVIGTPGGTTIPTSVLQTILNILEFNLSTEDAVYKPKFHHQWMPDMIMVENSFPQTVADSLKAMGYEVNKRGQIGRTEVIKITRPKKNKLVFEAVGDNRGDDDAEAY